ncbi:PqqD family protein [Blautia sp.]|uniref:PqqD family protein n=1 Tax=Blautia sp. TaxID=1955243 RepID=UPI003AB71993
MFKCQEGYTLRKIKGVSYILPFGQQIADQRKGTILNETSAFLWNVIQHNEGADLEMLTEMLARRYGLGEKDFPMLREDILDFLRQMQSMGMLTETLRLQSEESSLCILIAGLRLHFHGASQLFSGYFDKFREMNPAKDADQEIEFFTTPPASKSYGKVLLRNSDMTIFENTDRYVILFPQMSNIHQVHMSLDGSYVRFYCTPETSESAQENIFHAIRLFFLFVAQKHGKFAIHSASILYKEKAWLFSGHSGMGKSTHTQMWHDLLQTPYLNGDLNLLGMEDSKIIVYGIPWCGTSGIYTTTDHELGGIVLLGRDPEKDFLQELSPSEKVIRIMQRMISPSWKERFFSMNLDFAEKIAGQVPILHLLCTRNPSAVYTVQREIDTLEEPQ